MRIDNDGVGLDVADDGPHVLLLHGREHYLAELDRFLGAYAALAGPSESWTERTIRRSEPSESSSERTIRQ